MGGLDIVRIFPLPRSGASFNCWRGAVFLTLALSSCASPQPPKPPPTAEPTALIQSLPPETQQRAERALGALPQTGEQEPADVTLSFAGADIRDVIASVLGATLKLNYVVDPDVTGPVTFTVSRPLRRSD